MRHVNTEILTEIMDGRVSDDQKREVENHLTQCGECTELGRQLQDLVLQLQADAADEPPAELVEWGISLFQPLLQPATGGKLRKMIATLVFDTFNQPLQAGVRLAGTPHRQLLFRAGDIDVDVKIDSMEANDHITLVGQVLSTPAKVFAQTPVRLESRGGVRFQTITNPVGEFSFEEVPKDTYHLSVDLPEGQITLFCVHRGNS